MPSELLWTETHYLLNSALLHFDLRRVRGKSSSQRKCIAFLTECLEAIVDEESLEAEIRDQEEALPLQRGWGLWAQPEPCLLRVMLGEVRKSALSSSFDLMQLPYYPHNERIQQQKLPQELTL